MRHHLGFTVLVCALVQVLALSGCPDVGAAPAGAKFKYTAEGSGAENKAPLNPLRDGTVRGTFIVDGTVDLPTGRARRSTVGTGEYTYLLDTKVGLFIAGGTFDGVLEHPVLLVPATVRQGMKWEVTLEGEKPAYFFEVALREEKSSLLGPIVEWSIVQTDAAGAKTGRTYAEGIGATTEFEGVNVMPLDAPDPEPSKAARYELEPLGTGVTSPSAVTSASISMVRPAGHDALLMYDDDTVSGLGATSAMCWKLNTDSAVLVPTVPGLPVRRARPEVCPSMNKAFTGPDATKTLKIAAHASGALVEADGYVRWLAREHGLAAGAGLNDVNSPNDTRRLTALLPDGDGGVELLFSRESDYFELEQPNLKLPNSWFTMSDTPQFISPITTDEGDRRTLLLMTFDRMLWLTTISPGGITTPVQLGRLGGTLSVQATERGHEILRVTSDGQVDRLHVKEGKLSLEPLARVSVPVKALAEAAFLLRAPAGDRLVVVMLVATGAALTNGFQVFRSVGPVVESAERVALAPALSVSAAGGNSDYVACVSPSTQGVDVASWKFGGAPAGVVVETAPNSGCALVVRGPGQVVDESNGTYTVSGSVPGYGRVVSYLANPPSSVRARLSTSVPRVFAPTPSGAVDPLRTYGRGLFPLRPTSLTPRPFQGVGHAYGEILPMWLTPPLVDARGDGLWAVRKAANVLGSNLVRYGAAPFDRTVESLEVHAVSSRGGVLAYLREGVMGSYHWERISSGAPAVMLPAPPPGGTYCAELSDGTLCGNVFDGIDMRRRYFCVPPGGTPRLGFTSDAVSGNMLQCRGAVVLSDDSLVADFFPRGMYRIDTTTMVGSPYLPEPLWTSYATDGTAWGATVSDAGIVKVYRLNPSGPQLAVTGTYTMPELGRGQQYQLVVDDDVFMVVGKVADPTFLRIPRLK